MRQSIKQVILIILACSLVHAYCSMHDIGIAWRKLPNLISVRGRDATVLLRLSIIHAASPRACHLVLHPDIANDANGAAASWDGNVPL